jgi:hypothetical protein
MRLALPPLAAALILGLLVLSCSTDRVTDAASFQAAHVAMPDDHSAPATRAAFRAAMRKLWEDHITWTRLFIISAAEDLSDVGPTADRLLRNQQDLGDAIKPFYGEAAGQHLTALLRDHILIAADLVAAAKAGNSAGVDEASARWYANADEIAAFLSAANPANWPPDEMRAMMRSHLDLTLAEAVARLRDDYVEDIAVYEQVHAQILHMADMLSAGIINQFPQKLR